jgi:23S rRNA (uridine2552-2'-O)-methyltransferase
VGREKPDFYALKAQKEGYPARSVYKLEEIHQKLGILKRDARVLDVGSSPGSWSLYVLKFLKGSGFVVGVDLNPVTLKEFPPNSFFFQGDIFEPKTEAKLRERGPYGIVLSDAAPLTTGNRLVDTGRSFRLCERVLELATTDLLTHQGTLVMKVFQGGDEKLLTDRMREQFTQVKTLRPQAVRRESFETYLIGLGKRRV